MSLPIQLISTDFDGTLYADFENPPIPHHLEAQIAALQERGAQWVINTGRDLSSLMELLGRARVSVKPDYVVVVEREIYRHENSQYLPLDPWNRRCARAHTELFARVRPDVPSLVSRISGRFEATIYEDAWSPFCLIADRLEDAEPIHEILLEYCREVPELTLVRNDVYARFSHVLYNKGTALSHVSRTLGIRTDNVLAAGDHYNDLPMLMTDHARWLVAPGNAIEPVKSLVRRQNGYVSHLLHGSGLADGLSVCLEQAEALMSAT